jgi:hypothetical protein
MMTTEKQLPQTLFGVGPAEKYLVDTLNELQRKKVTARCMAMISASRAWASKFNTLLTSGAMSVKDVGNLTRLFKAEQAVRYSALNKALDDDLANWAPELTPEGLAAKQLEARALKLAMNVSTACMKQVGLRIARTRGDQLRRERQLRHARRMMRAFPPVDLASMKLPPEQEARILKLIATALKGDA